MYRKSYPTENLRVFATALCDKYKILPTLEKMKYLAPGGDITLFIILAKAPRLLKTLPKGNHALYCAASIGDAELVELCVKYDKKNINRQFDGVISLLSAAGEGHTKCVEILLKLGVDATLAHHKGIIPLLLAS